MARNIAAYEDAGFEFEEPDYSVGIYGGYSHWCSAKSVADDEPAIDISEGWAFDRFSGSGSERIAIGQRSLVCNACGANVSWTETEWNPEVHEHDDLRD